MVFFFFFLSLFPPFFPFFVKVEFPGLDGSGGPLYIGTGCFHRRDVLCGKKYSKRYRNDWNSKNYRNSKDNVTELEEKSKQLANCSYEENTQWGKEVDPFARLHLFVYTFLSHISEPDYQILICRWV